MTEWDLSTKTNIKIQLDLQGEGDTPICDTIVNRRRDLLVEIMKQSALEGVEKAQAVFIRSDFDIQREVVEVAFSETGQTHNVTNPATNDEVIEKFNTGPYTSAAIIHTHPQTPPRPSVADLDSGLDTLELGLGFIIVGEVVTDIPEDFENVMTSTLDKSIAVWGMEAPGPDHAISSDKKRRIIERAKDRASQEIDFEEPLIDDWQVTSVMLQAYKDMGINTCYHILGRKKELFDMVDV